MSNATGGTNFEGLHIEYVETAKLIGLEYYPKKFGESNKKILQEGITNFGYCSPIVVNKAKGREYKIIDGHVRVEIAKDMHLKTVPCVFVHVPNVEHEKELHLRLNKSASEFDIDLLKEYDPTLLLDVGFNAEDLTSIWDDILDIEDDHFDVEKELEKIKVPETKVGDLYQLGKHRLLCADSQDINQLNRLFGSAKADMFYTDFPYNIGLSYNKGIGGKGKYGGKTNDSKSPEEYKTFLKTIFTNTLEFTKPDAHFFSYCDGAWIWLIQKLYKELGIDYKRVCVWLKNNMNVTPQIAFNKVAEFCVYGTIGKPYLSDKVKNLNEVLNKEIGTGNRLSEDILDLMNIWLVKRMPSSDYTHPTEKNPTLHEKSLRRCTKPGDIICDLTAGSGSLLSACHQLNRVAYLVEIEPIFCDLIVARYERLTNDKAKLIN